MQQGSLNRVHEVPAPQGGRLEPYRRIVVEMMRRQRLCTAEVARDTGLDRSHLGKVRRGLKPMSGNMLDVLIAYTGLDRHRLSLAVEVLGSSEIYFNRAFQNLCVYFEEVVKNLLEVLREPAAIDRTGMFASLTRDFCKGLASVTVRHVDDRLAKIAAAVELRADTELG